MIIPNGIIDQKPKNVNKFWMLYHDAVIGSGILEKIAEWYVNWAQRFALSMKGKKLRYYLGNWHKLKETHFRIKP